MTLSRRTLLRSLPLVAALPRTLLAAPALPRRLYIGTGTQDPSHSKGIYVAPWTPDQTPDRTADRNPDRAADRTSSRISDQIALRSSDPSSTPAEIGPPTLAAELPSPTFLALSPRAPLLYALSEVPDAAITAFRIDPATGALTRLNQSPAQGDGPAHIAVNHDGRSVFIANYGSGSITSFRIEKTGALSAPISHVQYTPTDTTPEHQKSHAHAVTPSPDGRWLIVNDLGLDRVLVYRINPATAELTPNNPPFYAARRKSGPRHFAFHPNHHWAYSVNELDSTVDLLYWDPRHGTLTPHGPFVSTLPPDYPRDTAFCSEILVTPDGRFVYVANRRNETIAVLHVNPADGALTLAQLAPHGGRTARHITLDPSGRWLLVADQDSNGIVLLARNPASGALSAPLHTYPIDSPQCLVFA